MIISFPDSHANNTVEYNSKIYKKISALYAKKKQK